MRRLVIRWVLARNPYALTLDIGFPRTKRYGFYVGLLPMLCNIGISEHIAMLELGPLRLYVCSPDRIISHGYAIMHEWFPFWTLKIGYHKTSELHKELKE